MTEDELKFIVDVQIFIDELIEIVGEEKRFENFNKNLKDRRQLKDSLN